MAKLTLKIRSTISMEMADGRRISGPFGAEDGSGRSWYRIPPGERLTCKRCGSDAATGWRRGLNGKTAYCARCVVLQS